MYTIINMTNVIPVTEARKKLLNLVDEVNDSYSRIDLTKKGKVKAALVSPDYLDSLEETIYSLRYSLKDIREAEADFRKGKSVSLEEIENDLQKRIKNAS